jgi:hypothetical protein
VRLQTKDIKFTWWKPPVDGPGCPEPGHLPTAVFGIPIAELPCLPPDRNYDTAKVTGFVDAARRCWAEKCSGDRLFILSSVSVQYLDQPKDEYAPLEDSTLHRDFAALSATLGAVCAFARSHGSLTWGDPIILVDADGTPLDPVKASETLGTRSDRPWPLVHAEPVSLWWDEIIALRKCLEIDVILRSMDVEAMRRLVGIGEETFCWLLSEEDQRRLLRRTGTKTSFQLPEVRLRQLFRPDYEIPPAARTHGNEPRAMERMLRLLLRDAVNARLHAPASGLQVCFSAAAPSRSEPGSLTLDCGCLLTAVWAQAAGEMSR